MEFDLSKIEMSKRDLKRGVILPNCLTLQLSEFLGIIVGDGHLSFYYGKNRNGSISLKSDVRIAGNKKEEEYLKYIMNLFYSLFRLRMNYNQDTTPNSIILRACSKGIVQFLNKTCDIPLNKKTDIVSIPRRIKEANDDIKRAFLRGLADTFYCYF